MKGIVFNLLEDVVTAEYGADVWDDLLAAADADGAYTSLGTYPDRELVAIVGAASARLGLPAPDIIRWFGRKAMARLAVAHGSFFAGHRSTRPFLLTLNQIIHPEVRKLHPGADVPDFDFDTSDPDILGLGYRSHRRMCSFAEGLIEGAADHYREVATIEHPQCMHRGDARCLIRVSFRPDGS
ncbi:MAG: heme NO-binding domain-containing protein [Gemmatimonadales bacterium]|nr:heme NO-binding domain-containing protein [Gemmatimonadales bacterium]